MGEVNERMAQLTGSLIQSDIHPANIEQAKRINDEILRKNGSRIDFFKPVYLLKTGKVEAAVEAFVKLHQAVGDTLDKRGDFYLLWSLNAFFIPEYEGVLKNHFKALEARHGSSEFLISLELKLLYSGKGPGLDFLKGIAGKFPKNEAYLSQLFMAYQKQGLKKEALEVLEKFIEVKPESRTYRAALFAVLLDMDRSVEALVLNEDTPENMLAENYFTELRLKQNSDDSYQKILSVVPLPGISIAPTYGINRNKLKAALKAKDKDEIRKTLRPFGRW